MTKLFITSPNIIRDKSFRRRLSRLPGGVGGGGGAGGAADEAFEVVRQALQEQEGSNEEHRRTTVDLGGGEKAVVVAGKAGEGISSFFSYKVVTWEMNFFISICRRRLQLPYERPALRGVSQGGTGGTYLLQQQQFGKCNFF